MADGTWKALNSAALRRSNTRGPWPAAMASASATADTRSRSLAMSLRQARAVHRLQAIGHRGAAGQDDRASHEHAVNRHARDLTTRSATAKAPSARIVTSPTTTPGGIRSRSGSVTAPSAVLPYN